jgi:sulfite oxidase
VVILSVEIILIISDEESKSHWQQKDYKSLSPTITENPDYSKFTAIQSVPVTSAICEPKPGSSLKVSGDSGSVFVKGYAYSGGGNSVVRVDVSSDGGKTWKEAEVERASDAPAPPRNW